MAHPQGGFVEGADRFVEFGEFRVLGAAQELGAHPPGEGAAVRGIGRLDGVALGAGAVAVPVLRRAVRRRVEEHPGRSAGLGQPPGERLHRLARLGYGAVAPGADQPEHQVARVPALAEGVEFLADAGDPPHRVEQRLAFHRPPAGDHADAVRRTLEQVGVQVAVVQEVAVFLFRGGRVLHPVERRLGDVEVALVYQPLHPAVEEGEQERADVGTVHIGVGHDDHRVVAEGAEVEFRVHPGAEGGDEHPDLLVLQHPVEAGLLHIQDLSPQRQDGLETPVAPLLRRTAGGLALDDEDLAGGGVALLAVGEFAGERGGGEGALAAGHVTRFPGGFPGAEGVHRLRGDALRLFRVLLEEPGEALVHHLFDEALDAAVAEFRLGLPFELRLGHPDADDRGEADAGVFAEDAPALEFLAGGGVRGVGVDRLGERRPQAAQVGAALRGAHIVGVGVDPLLVAVVPLHGHFAGPRPGAVVLRRPVRLEGERDHRVVDRALLPGEVGDELGDPAFVVEGLLPAVALVEQADADAAHQEGEFADPVGDQVVVELGGLFEDRRVREEAHQRPGVSRFGGPGFPEGAGAFAAAVGLLPDPAAAAHLHPQPGGERVHHRDADAVESGGELVGLRFELAAGVEAGHDHFDRRQAGARFRVHRDPAAVVPDREAPVLVDGDFDAAAVAAHGLVHAVVHHFAEEVVEPGRPGGADVHGGPDADRLEALQDADVPARVLGRGRRRRADAHGAGRGAGAVGGRGVRKRPVKPAASRRRSDPGCRRPFRSRRSGAG